MDDAHHAEAGMFMLDCVDRLENRLILLISYMIQANVWDRFRELHPEAVTWPYEIGRNDE
jgi:hypothetical protein